MLYFLRKILKFDWVLWASKSTCERPYWGADIPVCCGSYEVRGRTKGEIWSSRGRRPSLFLLNKIHQDSVSLGEYITFAKKSLVRQKSLFRLSRRRSKPSGKRYRLWPQMAYRMAGSFGHFLTPSRINQPTPRSTHLRLMRTFPTVYLCILKGFLKIVHIACWASLSLRWWGGFDHVFLWLEWNLWACHAECRAMVVSALMPLTDFYWVEN